ncbi:MAG: DUF4179 domain-containing protein [Oscillospiraceae bacterium]|nr:DUF4179 domain-containing protein [Oscillospiraceae bacterium]
MKSEDLLLALNDLDDDLIFDTVKKPARPKSIRRRLSTILIAAAIASTLAITAFASKDGASWFRSFFAQNSHLALTDSQEAYIGENTAQFQQSQTKNGYTISLESAFSDGVKTLIQLRVTAPENVPMALDRYTPGNWGNTDFLVNEVGETYFYSGGWDTIDEDKTDNVVTLLYESDNFWYEKGIDQIFGHTWTLRFVGLRGRNKMTIENMDDPPEEQHITDGIWEFTIEFPESGNETLEFISEPTPCTVTHNFSAQGFIEDTVTVTSLKVRALSVALHFQHPKRDEINAYFDDIFAVMKDGSPVLMNPCYNSPNFQTFTFDAPIVLDEVDHIFLPNGTKLYPATK